MLIAGAECEPDEFPARAKAIVEYFGMKVVERTDGGDVMMWITRIGKDEFCISWDHWLGEVSIMAWKATGDEAMEALLRASGPFPDP
jgi:hypothetical protein